MDSSSKTDEIKIKGAENDAHMTGNSPMQSDEILAVEGQDCTSFVAGQLQNFGIGYTFPDPASFQNRDGIVAE